MPKTSIKYPRKSKRLKRRPMQLTIPNEHPYPLQSMIADEILGRILFGGYLDNTSRQLSTIRSVCPRFNSLARTFCKSLDARPSFCWKGEMVIRHQHINRLFPSLFEVNFSFIKDFDDYCMQKLSPLSERLRVLKLRETSVTDAGVENYLGFNTLYHRKVTKPLPLEVLDLSKTSMKCRDVHHIGKRAMKAIVSYCPDLKSLEVSMCKIDDKGIKLLSSKLHKLELLDVSMCPITARGCSYLALLSSLRAVNISSLSIDSIPHINGQAIYSLVTGYCPSNYDVFNDEQMTEEMECKHTSSLTAICAQYATAGVHERLLEILYAHAPQLKCLDLRNYLGYDASSERCLSPMKQSVRNLTRNGTSVAFSYAKG